MEITRVLQSVKKGEQDARADLVRIAYDDLRQLAAGRMRDERLDHTLSATGLVHEVSMKILRDGRVPVTSRGKFFAYASKAMRHLLIDHARHRGRQKRGGDRKRVALDQANFPCEQPRQDVLALHQAVEVLARLRPRQARVVKMRFFAELTTAQIAQQLGISRATVKRDLIAAKSWLLRELMRQAAAAPDQRASA